MEDDELDKLATDAKLDQIGAGEKGDYLDELYGGKGAGYDKSAGTGGGYGPTAVLNATGRSQLDQVMRVFADAGRSIPRSGPQLRPVAPRGQVGQLGQLQLQMASPGRPSQLGPQLCTPRPLMAMSGGGRSTRSTRRRSGKRRRCSCNH